MHFFLTAPTQYDCNFENNQQPLCQWQQDKTDQFDWTRAQGPTGSFLTGPTVDHTTGTSKLYDLFYPIYFNLINYNFLIII